MTLVRDHVKRADGVICVSEYTASEARRLLDVPDEKIAVTPHGVDPVFRQEPHAQQVDETLRRLRLPRGGILYVGSEEKRKNLVTLVMAYMTLARRRRLPPLVLAGPGSDWAQGGSYSGPQIVATGYLETRRRARADGGLRRAGAAVARGGLRAAGRRGDGRRAAGRLLARLRARRGRGRRGEPRGPARRERPRARASSACSRTARSPPSCAASGLERSRAFEWSTTAARDARLLPQGPWPLARWSSGSTGASSRGVRREPAATSATCCATGARPATRSSSTSTGRPRSTRCSTTSAIRKRPLGDGVARGICVAGGPAAPAPPAPTRSTSSSRRPTPARCGSTGRASRPCTTSRSSRTRRTSAGSTPRAGERSSAPRSTPRSVVPVCSAFTARELARLFPDLAERAVHIPLGADGDLPAPPPRDEARQRSA